MIVGITGTLGAGKGAVVEFLKERGFKHYSARALITEEIERRGLPVNRDNMVIVGNDLREKNSPSYVAEQLYERAKKEGGNCVLESLRTQGEVEALKKKDKFVLLAVDADKKIRYERVVKRQSSTDQVSFEEFAENEEREMTSTDPNKQNLSKCIEIADFVIDNSGSIEELNNKVEDILAKLE